MMIDSRRSVVIFQGSVVFLLLLFSHSSKSDLCPFLFAVATTPTSETFHVSVKDRKSIISQGGSTTTSRILPADQNRTLPSAEIVLTTQYDFDLATMIRSADPAGNIQRSNAPLRVLFLSADTGGGHRASAEALAAQFTRYFNTTYELMDVWTPTKVYPYTALVPAYKHLSANPKHWRLLYHASNSRPYAIIADIHSHLLCYKMIRDQIAAYDPDVVISVHPTMNTLPLKAVRRISAKKKKYIPFFTCVTDFGSGHCTWFHGGVDKMYIASDRIRRLAKRRGWVPDSKLVMSGLPIRHGFALQAEKMGDRFSSAGQAYRENMKTTLGLDPKKPMILIMGGGEGVGSLSTITEALYFELHRQGINATICVVCGRNEQLRSELNGKNWAEVINQYTKSITTKRHSVKDLWMRFRRSKRIQLSLDRAERETAKSLNGQAPGHVDIMGLGFVSNMDMYMVATDILVTKAGPGTIAEATALSLPVMITSFLPGQEAGNVDIVLDNGFGDFCVEPRQIASELASWLKDPGLMQEMSKNSGIVGHPHAAASIVQDIGKITHEWMERNRSTGAFL